MNQVIGERYEIEELLSRKPGRQTFLARDIITGERVILKLLMFDLEFEWEALELFEREVRVLQTLSHPRIPRYLDSFELQDEKS